MVSAFICSSIVPPEFSDILSYLPAIKFAGVCTSLPELTLSKNTAIRPASNFPSVLYTETVPFSTLDGVVRECFDNKPI